jgi:argininosuccinate synthase
VIRVDVTASADVVPDIVTGELMSSTSTEGALSTGADQETRQSARLQLREVLLSATPGGTISHLAFRYLEGIAMDREVRGLRDMHSPRFAEIIYNGFWFSPKMDFVEAGFRQSKALIDSEVRLILFKGNVIVEGRSSPSSDYGQDPSSMDAADGYDQEDARGFIRINALRRKAHRLIVEHAGEE